MRAFSSSEHARFLGYDVQVRRNSDIKPSGKGFTQRTLSQRVELTVPLDDKIMKFLFGKDIIRQTAEGKIEPKSRVSLTRCTEYEIVSTYNAELRGICNYYSIASNFDRLDYFAYLMKFSCLKTLAHKHKSTTAKMIKKYKDGHGSWGIPYETKSGPKRCCFADYRKCRDEKYPSDIIPKKEMYSSCSRSPFELRLKAKVCELCGVTDAKHYEIHHIHKLKDLKGKAVWEKMMIAKRRKTMVLCKDCHKKIHGKRVSAE